MAKYGQLNLTEIAEGMIACRSNARELLEECDVLLSHCHFARAYALVHTVCEELAKFSILELGGKRLAQGNAPRWKRFWKRFRSHDSKIAQMSVQLLLSIGGLDDVLLRDVTEAVNKLFDYGLEIRNSALYVDVGPDGKFGKPSDIDFIAPLPILYTAAKLALEATNRRGQSINDIELTLRKLPSQSDQQCASNILVKMVQRAKDTGVAKSEMEELLFKAFNK